jgi:glycosyltransferase involved in cell wall biosynthesis
MACGVPVVTLANSAFLEFAAGAYMCDDAAPETLYAGMDAVLSSPTLRARLGAAGIERARDYHWEGIARRTMATLVEVAKA